MNFEPSMVEEIPHIIKICTRCDVLSKEEEYALIKIAKPSIRAQKILNKKKYQKSLSRRPELKAYLHREAEKGKRAQTKLLEHNYRLIISIAKKLKGRGLGWEDMIQHGSDGLLYAVEKFNLGSGNKLSTYASQWIRQRIGRAIENTGRLIRIPIHMQDRIYTIKYIYRKYLEINQELPGPDEIASFYNLNPRAKKNFKPITREEAEELGRYMQDIESLNKTCGEDDNLSAMDYVRDEGDNPSEIAERELNKEKLSALLEKLEPQDAGFLKFKYGLIDEQAKTDMKVAEAFKMTVREVRDKEHELILKLRELSSIDEFNLEKEKVLYKIALLGCSNPKAIEDEIGPVLKGNVFPQIIWESESYDQMLILCRRLNALGARVSLLHT